MIMGLRTRAAASLLVLAAVAAVAACAHDQHPAGDPARAGVRRSSPAVTPVPSISATVGSRRTDRRPRSGELDQAQTDLVLSYLSVRENAESVLYADDAAWRRAIARYTTHAGGNEAVKRYAPAETSNAQTIARQGNYVVGIALGGCTSNPAFDNTRTRMAAQCDLTDLLLTKDGAVVPTEEIDPGWPYSGPQPSPLLVLRKVRDQWRVDADYTGQAS